MVFDGEQSKPYAEDAIPSARSVYGRSKAEGERLVLETLPDTGVVLRSSWLYADHGKNFVRTVARYARERERVDVAADQMAQPTWTVDFARRILDVGRRDAAHGIYHATNAGEVSRYDLARAVFVHLGLDPERVRPVSSTWLRHTVRRPANAVLSHGRWAELDMRPMRAWDDALAEAAWPVLYRPENREN
jgi:dTDP-4-dehydrorhamnose reductase